LNAWYSDVNVAADYSQYPLLEVAVDTKHATKYTLLLTLSVSSNMSLWA